MLIKWGKLYPEVYERIHVPVLYLYVMPIEFVTLNN